MVTIKDACSSSSLGCEWKEKLATAYNRAVASVNKVLDNSGSVYYPDGTGAVTLPLLSSTQLTSITQAITDVASLKTDVASAQSDIDDLKALVETYYSTVNDRMDSLNTATNDRIDTTNTNVTNLSTSLSASLATVDSRITEDERLISANSTSIDDLNEWKTDHDAKYNAVSASVDALKNSIVDSVTVTDGTTNGSFIVNIVEKDNTTVSSSSYPYGKPSSLELQQGSQEGYVKAILTLADNTTITSNDFQILQITDSDVYVTAITLNADYDAGTLGGTIGYSNGNTADINSIDIPTAPGVTSNINSLLTRMTAVETSASTNATDIDALETRVQAIEDTPGVGGFTNTSRGTILGTTTDGYVNAQDDFTGKVNGWDTLNTTVSGLSTSKQDTLTAGTNITISGTTISSTDSASAINLTDGRDVNTAIASIEDELGDDDSAGTIFSRISSLESSQSTQNTNIATNTSNISSLQSSVTTNTSNISALTTSTGKAFGSVDAVGGDNKLTLSFTGIDDATNVSVDAINFAGTLSWDATTRTLTGSRTGVYPGFFMSTDTFLTGSTRSVSSTYAYTPSRIKSNIILYKKQAADYSNALYSASVTSDELTTALSNSEFGDYPDGTYILDVNGTPNITHTSAPQIKLTKSGSTYTYSDITASKVYGTKLTNTFNFYFIVKGYSS